MPSSVCIMWICAGGGHFSTFQTAFGTAVRGSPVSSLSAFASRGRAAAGRPGGGARVSSGRSLALEFMSECNIALLQNEVTNALLHQTFPLIQLYRVPVRAAWKTFASVLSLSHGFDRGGCSKDAFVPVVLSGTHNNKSKRSHSYEYYKFIFRSSSRRYDAILEQTLS